MKGRVTARQMKIAIGNQIMESRLSFTERGPLLRLL